MRKFRIVLVLMLIFSVMGLAAQSEANYYNKPISNIVFDGLNLVKKDDIYAIINQFKGKRYSDELYNELVTKIYALDAFDPNFTAEALPGDENYNTVILKFTVKELPVITHIRYKGNKQIKLADIKDVVKVKELDILNEKRIPSDERAIRNLYLDKGFTNVKVSSDIEIKPNGEVNLTFLITEGMATIVTDIKFEGVHVIDPKTLKSKFSQKEKSIFNKGYFQESSIEQDRQVILAFYHSRGYIDAVVSETVSRDVTFNEEEGREEIVLTYFVTEGESYTYGGIQISGNSIFTTKELSDCIKMNVGDVFNELKFQEGLGALLDLYYENGYTFNTFVPKMNADPVKKEVSYTLQIVEKERSHIENIIVKGNEKTKDYVIIREIPLESGDIFSKSKLTSGLRNLNNLQYFSSVYPQIVPGSEENLVDLILTVEEQSTTSLEFGLTFSGVTETSDIPISLFAKWQDSNLGGTGLTLSSQLTISNTEQSIALSYTDPWFLDKPITLSLSAAFYHRMLTTLQYMYFPTGVDETHYYMDYTNWTTSFAASLGRRWTYDFAILTTSGGISFNLLNNVYDSLSYTPVDTTISDTNNDWGWTNTIWGAVSLDGRNVNYDASKGWFVSQRLSWTGIIPLIEDQFFLRSDTKLELYAPLADVPVGEKWAFKLTLMGYSGFSFQVPVTGYEIGSSNKLYIDGMFNGRGWSSDSSTKGLMMWSNIVELRWPFLPGIAALDFFFDAIVLGDSDTPFVMDANLPNWKFSFGLGPRICMPQFPLRFLFTFPFYFDDTGAFNWRTEDNAGFTFVLSFNIVNK
ncbi:MAG: outer membrane protein assembly factor BamA [Treponemataceae bacterium]|nr:outer membrane protein assembly factor BamA [Treponemataceae bacterium]